MGITRVLIVGAGQAAGEFSVQLRLNGFAGEIIMAGEEPYLPYQRPPLSKTFLAGGITAQSLLLKAPGAYEKACVTFIGNIRATRIEVANKQVEFDDGRSLGYDKLVLATGGRPRLLQLPGHGRFNMARNLHYFRTICHVERIREQFKANNKLVIIGGGYIGLEVAALARKCNIEVTVLEAQPRVLARVTAPEVSAFYQHVHQQEGVQILLDTPLHGFELDDEGDVTHVLAGNDLRIQSDVVIVGIGQVPNVELAQTAGLSVDDGITVDEYGRTDNEDIFAIGDCSNHPSIYAGRRLRLESVPNALEQARSTAAFLVGKMQPYNAVPWFWSDQYDLKLQMVGLNQGYDQIVLRGQPESRSFIVFYLKNGRLLAADAISRPGEFALAKKLVSARAVLSYDQLADETKSLKELIGINLAA